MAGIAAIVAFAETVRQGGFARAARALGLSPSAVAKSVARLEADLGVTLLHRTTRQVRPTGEGRDLYARCQAIVEEIDALRSEAEGVRAEPAGTLRLNLPLVYGRDRVVPVLAQLAGRHPKLAFEIGFSDTRVDLVAGGLDAVVRIGKLDDSRLVARRIGRQRLLVCASPRYLSEAGEPRTPADLATHRCMSFRMPGSGRIRHWEFRDARRAIEFEPASGIVFDDGEALAAAAIASMGIAQLPDYMVSRPLRDAALVELLSGFEPEPLPISLVFPGQRRPPPRMRALIDALTGPGPDGNG